MNALRYPLQPAKTVWDVRSRNLSICIAGVRFHKMLLPSYMLDAVTFQSLENDLCSSSVSLVNKPGRNIEFYSSQNDVRINNVKQHVLYLWQR